MNVRMFSLQWGKKGDYCSNKCQGWNQLLASEAFRREDTTQPATHNKPELRKPGSPSREKIPTPGVGRERGRSDGRHWRGATGRLKEESIQNGVKIPWGFQDQVKTTPIHMAATGNFKHQLLLKAARYLFWGLFTALGSQIKGSSFSHCFANAKNFRCSHAGQSLVHVSALGHAPLRYPHTWAGQERERWRCEGRRGGKHCKLNQPTKRGAQHLRLFVFFLSFPVTFFFSYVFFALPSVRGGKAALPCLCCRFCLGTL